MFCTPLFSAEICDWVVNEAYPEVLQEFPKNYFYAVVSSDGRCEYGHGTDEESGFKNCEKWKKENSISEICKPFAIGKEIVWESNTQVQLVTKTSQTFVKKAARACEWIFDDGHYQEYLDDLPSSDFHSAFYLVVGKVGTKKSGVCTYAWRWDPTSNRSLIDVKRQAKADCDKYKLQFQIEGECRPYDINKEIVWDEKLLKKWIVWNKKLEKKYKESKVIEKAIQIPDSVTESFIKIHNRALDENNKTFVYDDGKTYLVGSEKIDIKDAIVKKKKILVLEEKQDKETQYHYCLRLNQRSVFYAGKKCSELTSSKDPLMEITEDQFQQIKKEQRSYQTSQTLLSIVDTHVSQNGKVKKIEVKKTKRLFIIPEDNKKGRSLADRPDTNSDYKIHVMYILPKEERDKEMDINGKLEKMVFNMDKFFFKATSNTKKNIAKGKDQGHRLKLDLTEEGKLDITFVRLPWNKKDIYKECKKWMGNDCPYLVDFVNDHLARNGYFERKKVYSILFDIYEFGTGKGYWGHGNISDPGVGYSVPWGYTYYKGCAREGKKSCERVMLHELIHSFGFTKACHQFSKKDDPAHQTIRGDLMYSGPDSGGGNKIDKSNQSYYLHGDPNCFDLADVVYLRPTSSKAFDPAVVGF